MERDQSAPAQTAPQQAGFGSDRTSAFLPWKTKNKRLVLRARAPVLNTVTILRDRVVRQYSSTIARWEQDAPFPNRHQ